MTSVSVCSQARGRRTSEAAARRCHPHAGARGDHRPQRPLQRAPRRATRSTSIRGVSVRGALTADDIVAVDLDGALLEGTARPPLEFHIHAEIYRARPDVNAVMHTHPRWSTFLTMTGVDVQAGHSAGRAARRRAGARFAAVGEHQGRRASGWPQRSASGARGAAQVTRRRVVGADIVECFALAAYLEENACRQYMAMQIGEPYVFSEAEQQACRQESVVPEPCSGRRGTTIDRGSNEEAAAARCRRLPSSTTVV